MRVGIAWLPFVILQFRPVDRLVCIARQIGRGIKSRRRPLVPIVVLIPIVTGRLKLAQPLRQALIVGSGWISLKHELLQTAYFRLGQFHIPRPHQTLGKANRTEANPCKTTHHQAECIKNATNFPIPSFRKRHAVPVIGPVTAHVLQTVKACHTVVEIDAVE
jgi:hypothetical protein